MRLTLAQSVRAGLVALCLAELVFLLHPPARALSRSDDGAALHACEPSVTREHPAATCGRWASDLLLRRVHGAMRYNTSSQQFEAPVMAFWLEVEPMLASDPAAGWAAQQQLLLTAKHPWAIHWASKLVPDSWQLMSQHTRENLQLLQAGLPAFTPLQDAAPLPMCARSWWLALQPQLRAPAPPSLLVRCSAGVNASSLLPEHEATCVISPRANASDVRGSFTVAPGPWGGAVPAAGGALGGLAAAGADGSCRLLGRGLVLGPLLHDLGAAAGRASGRAGALLRGARGALLLAVPTAGLSGPLCGLLGGIGVVEEGFPLKALVLRMLVLLVCVRNWLYLAIVGYKISRRLALLAPLPRGARAGGFALTLLGCTLGLWQSLAYASLDAGLDVALAQLALWGACRAPLVLAHLVWLVSFRLGLFELRAGHRLWQLAKTGWREAVALVLAPQVLLLHAPAADKPPPRAVATVGSWPQPLAIPEEVDDLPVAEVPRGFICPITQAIMRQPALLLHDRTVAPSTYDRDAISQWLAEHSSDPKNPGVALRMKSVKLVYNGDLGRAIEDWVSARLAMVQRARHESAAPAPAPLASLQQHLAEWDQQAQAAQAAAAAATLMQVAQQQQQQQQQRTRSAASPQPRQQPAARARRRPGGAAAAAPAAAAAGRQAAAGAAGAPARSGSVLSDAGGALVRTSSAALAHVASLDLPTAARVTTRAVARRLRQQQPIAEHGGEDAGGQDSSSGDEADSARSRGRRQGSAGASHAAARRPPRRSSAAAAAAD